MSLDERLDDAGWLAAAYRHRSGADIAAELGCHAATVHRALRRFGVPLRGRGGHNRGRAMPWEQRAKIADAARRRAREKAAAGERGAA